MRFGCIVYTTLLDKRRHKLENNFRFFSWDTHQLILKHIIGTYLEIEVFNTLKNVLFDEGKIIMRLLGPIPNNLHFHMVTPLL